MAIWLTFHKDGSSKINKLFDGEGKFLGGATATNTGENHRDGAVTGRTQHERADGDWQKRDREDGEFMKTKKDGEPFKGVAKEPDRRQDKE